MAQTSSKYEKSKYKYVIKEMKSGHTYFMRSKMFGYGHKRYKTEREAALSADRILIDNNKEPVNILIRQPKKYPTKK